MSISHTSNSSPNSSYTPNSPSGSAEITNSDAPLDLQSSEEQEHPRIYTGSASDSASNPLLYITSPRLHLMEDDRKGKGVSRDSSPSASSQGDLADNEMEAGSNPPAQPSSTPAPLPKKKRTRTLTTPHQAAVLHALLAQSRFPTTAMREEVGRSIGLSARKVQIWFQNQRQKARRPRGQNLPPLTRPPQYGPFPSVPSGSSANPGSGSSSRRPEGLHLIHAEGESPVAYSASKSASPSTGSDVHGYRDSFSSEGSSARSLAFSSQLSGPGVPGGLPASPPSPRAIRSAPYPRAEIRGGFSNFFIPASSRPFTADDSSRSMPRPPFGMHPLRHSLDTGPSITLPPLTFDRPRSNTVSGPSGSSGRLHVTSPSSILPSPLAPVLPPVEEQARQRILSLQSDSPFAYDAPVPIPPPFTLQPRPQWDDSSFSPFSRPSIHARNPYNRFSYESFTLPPTDVSPPRETTSATTTTTTTPLPPILSTIFPPSNISRTSSTPTPTSPDPSGSTLARHRRYDDADAKSHDQDVAK